MMCINPIRFAIVNQDEKSNLSNLQQKTRVTLMKIKYYSGAFYAPVLNFTV